MPTRILLGVNYVLRHDWLILLAALTGLVFLFRWSIGTARGRYQWDWFKIKVPVIGPLLFNLVMSRLAKVLSELLASGLPLMQTLELVSEIHQHLKIKKEEDRELASMLKHIDTSYIEHVLEKELVRYEHQPILSAIGNKSREGLKKLTELAKNGGKQPA